MTKSVVAFQNLHKWYPGEPPLHVLKGINLNIHQGELVAIMGRSGSGKSTLLNIMGLMDRPHKGQYLLEGVPTENLCDDARADLRNLKLGFVFQQFQLLPRLTAVENVALPLSYRGQSRHDALVLAEQTLHKMGLSDRMRHFPNQLSGGQQQRVAIARALVGEPAILLADEPTGALDSQVGQQIMNLFKQLNQQDGITIVIITHDEEVAHQCDRTIDLQDGRVVGR